MKSINLKNLIALSFLIFFLGINFSFGQTAGDILPKGFAPGEKEVYKDYLEQTRKGNRNITTAPEGTFLRSIGEWEEVQALVITWTGFLSVHRNIIKAVQNETPIIIVCSDSVSVKNNLTSNNVPLTNLSFVVAPYNSVWIRDYFANSVYTNDVDSLVLVDWVYNRPRPKDDTLARSVARHLNLNIYETSQAPYSLVNTGGNFMSDGLGTGFASNLVLMENPITNNDINEIMKQFMGIGEYIKMPVLPYDGIHHIDMHMKLLDEETLLMGQYPAGIADGPQIEANLQYILSNFKTFYGRDFKVVRIPMPPQQNGQFPPSGNYLTYANNSIINKTVIVPTYYEEYDTTALRIIKQAMPGYNVVGINSNATISSGGSLHCITHTIGVADPLFISHKSIRDTVKTGNPISVEAVIRHRSGISLAEVYFRTSPTQAFQNIPLSFSGGKYTAGLPSQPAGTTVEYYIYAEAVSGKKQSKPMPAPSAFYSFFVEGPVSVEEGISDISFSPAFPNPSKGITCIPVYSKYEMLGSLKLLDLSGREVALVFEGRFPKGEQKYFIDTSKIPAGAYLLVIQKGDARKAQKLMVR